MRTIAVVALRVALCMMSAGAVLSSDAFRLVDTVIAAFAAASLLVLDEVWADDDDVSDDDGAAAAHAEGRA